LTLLKIYNLQEFLSLLDYYVLQRKVLVDSTNALIGPVHQLATQEFVHDLKRHRGVSEVGTAVDKKRLKESENDENGDEEEYEEELLDKRAPNGDKLSTQSGIQRAKALENEDRLYQDTQCEQFISEASPSIPEANPKSLFDSESKRVFEKKYNAMVNSNKLMLKSGKYAEDVMFQHALKFQYIHFIFCPDDENSTKPFTQLELDELNESQF
ncbi:hypothetical protein HK100_005117, partial [Physocladia obscura]